jgi:hypothetical protein
VEASWSPFAQDLDATHIVFAKTFAKTAKRSVKRTRVRTRDGRENKMEERKVGVNKNGWKRENLV